MEDWIANGTLLKADANTKHDFVIYGMSNQVQIRKGSTATRNFPNRLGIDTQVSLGSAELATMRALTGRIV